MSFNPFSKEFILVPVLLNILVAFYNLIPDIGIVIILLTGLIRLALAPSFHKSIKSQAALSALQPKLNEIREKYKGDQQAQAKAMMELYKEHKVNPFSSCLPLLVQLPVLIALYFVFTQALANHLTGIYSFIPTPASISPMFLGFVDLSKNFTNSVSGVVLVLFSAATQYIQSKMMMPKDSAPAGPSDFGSQMSRSMLYTMPLMTVFIGWQFKLPNGLFLYWTATTVFSIVQQYWINRQRTQANASVNS